MLLMFVRDCIFSVYSVEAVFLVSALLVFSYRYGVKCLNFDRTRW